MSYEPTTWKDGDLVTAKKLNKLEQGVANAGGALFVTTTESDTAITLNSTYAEIRDAIYSGKVVYIRDDTVPYCSIVTSIMVSSLVDDHEYIVYSYDNAYRCSTENDYPSVAVE